MKRLVLGILAHVDSGKTTLSEGLLYTAGEIGKLGRVDHKDTFLDTNIIEKERGITIFSKQAIINYKDAKFTLLDTPGHVDFSAETERTLSVLDYAILVISASAGVQSHTKTLWKLLKHYNIPTFVFVNKMDLTDKKQDEFVKIFASELENGFVDFSIKNESFYENIAMADNELLEEYIENNKISETSIKNAIMKSKVFPCFFGSALKNEGVDVFLEEIYNLTNEKKYPKEFGAKIFKIADDDKGKRITFLKVTGGILKVKDILETKNWSSKINEIREYSGLKFKNVQEIYPGSVCAILGVADAYSGEGIGIEENSGKPLLEPLFTYGVILPQNYDLHVALSIFKKLEQEDSQMRVIWREDLKKIDIQVMGEIQLEVLKRVLDERFDLIVEFENGSIIYKETIEDTVEGVGHFEPLRHYAEVHLLIEPQKRGSGISFTSKCSEDKLDKNWQRLIMTHLKEKTHLGVLTGSPITDVKITIINGKAHKKHTEGGDFREATYRAVRQGLMQAKSVLLEPYYDFTLDIPTENIGRAMTDLQRLGAEFSPPVTYGEMSQIKGSAPVSVIGNYHGEVNAYTHGLGRFSCLFKGYDKCVNPEEVIEKISYDPLADLQNPPHSVFCAHGGGFTVLWNEVFDYADIPVESKKSEEYVPTKTEHKKIIANDEELLRIFEMTYGKVTKKNPYTLKTKKEPVKYKTKILYNKPTYLLIDGYNVIYACDEFKKIAEESLDDARLLLISRVSNYQAIKQNNVILVFDAYKVKGENREVEKVHGINVVYTKEAETADAYIEKTSKELSKDYKVTVATSDYLEQIIIFGNGAVRITAKEFWQDIKNAEDEMREFIKQNNN